MGAADVIPGVSGGTIAFITGIYEELLHSIKSINKESLNSLVKFRLGDFWKEVNGNFLLVLGLGIVTSIVTLARLMTYLLEHFPIQVWSFFFGLILISAPLILRDIRKWGIGTILSTILGVIIAYYITVVAPAQTPNHLAFIFLSGSLAICAMILPGISGAFILLLLGKYEFILNALHEMNLSVILVFSSGCFLGLIGFSRFLSWILTNYRFPTLALLSGFMIGSLNKVWPWKEVLTYRVDQSGQQVPVTDHNILPSHYFDVVGQDPKLLQAILFVALGILLVVSIERIANLNQTKL